ncbi:hypothetical protein [Acidovorax sp. A1169]|uniref:hypothetical protein n=1 Tax=Acidovorax sp. A1169 TaxID=3059524 RepID=UPI00273790B6|nr:hypothetical protein [Acidovorax sp. A1169]MDP4077672.1 hypothetical protein [Acidovorax sp. A1169]
METIHEMGTKIMQAVRAAPVKWVIAKWCAVFFALLATGCATKTEIADQAVKGSLATEDVNNRLLLLNIVRAYHRYPMHFVRFNGLRGPIGIGAPTVTIPTPVGPDFTNQIYQLSTTIKFDQPSFDLQLQDTQEFYRGLTTPLRPEVMQYFLEQGWPQQMILWLFVREIEITEDGKTKKRYLNYPQGDYSFEKFRNELERLQSCDIEMHEDKPVLIYGPPLDISTSTSPEKLAALKTAGVELVQVNDANGVRYQVQQTRKVVQLKLVAHRDSTSCDLPGDSAAFKGEQGVASTGGVKTVFTLRSVEAMIYFLGELSRRQLDGTLDGSMPGIYCIRYEARRDEARQKTAAAKARDDESSHDCEKSFPVSDKNPPRLDPLFVMEKNVPGEATVRVDYDGTSYSIPRGLRSGRSMHVMSLLTQLISLQNKSADLPTTQNVRVVNP